MLFIGAIGGIISAHGDDRADPPGNRAIRMASLPARIAGPLADSLVNGSRGSLIDPAQLVRSAVGQPRLCRAPRAARGWLRALTLGTKPLAPRGSGGGGGGKSDGRRRHGLCWYHRPATLCAVCPRTQSNTDVHGVYDRRPRAGPGAALAEQVRQLEGLDAALRAANGFNVVVRPRC